MVANSTPDWANEEAASIPDWAAEEAQPRNQQPLPSVGFWDFPKTGQEALRRTSAAAGALGEGIASIPDLPATLYELPTALTNPATLGAPYVQNLQAAVQRNPFAPNLGSKVSNWLDQQTNGALKPQTQQEQTGLAAIQGAGAAAPFGPMGALLGGVSGGTNQYAQNQGASPDQAALLALIPGLAVGADNLPQGGTSIPEALNNLKKMTPPPEPPTGGGGPSSPLSDAGIPFTKKPAENLSNIQTYLQQSQQPIQAEHLGTVTDPTALTASGLPQGIKNAYDGSVKQMEDLGTQAVKQVSPAPLDPNAFSRDLTKNYYWNKEDPNNPNSVANLYHNARAAGEGKFVDAEDLSGHIDNLLNQYKAPTQVGDSLEGAGPRPFLTNQQIRALNTMQQVQGKLSSINPFANDAGANAAASSTPLGLNDLVDLKRSVNDMFNPSSPNAGLGQLSDAVDQKLAAAKAADPQFGQAIDSANKAHALLRQNMEDNSVLSPMWRLDDAWGTRGNDKLGIPDLAPETQARANSIVNNVKTPLDLQNVTRYASPEQAAALRSAKLQQVLSNAGTDTSKLVAQRPLLESLMGKEEAAQFLQAHGQMSQALDDNFTNNPTLTKFYKPGDSPAAMQSKAVNIVKNIQTPQDVDTLEQYTTPSQNGTIKAAKISDIRANSTPGNSGMSENSQMLDRLSNGNPDIQSQHGQIRQVHAYLKAKGIDADTTLEQPKSVIERIGSGVKGAGYGLASIKSPLTSALTLPRALSDLGDAFGPAGPNAAKLQALTKSELMSAKNPGVNPQIEDTLNQLTNKYGTQ